MNKNKIKGTSKMSSSKRAQAIFVNLLIFVMLIIIEMRRVVYLELVVF